MAINKATRAESNFLGSHREDENTFFDMIYGAYGCECAGRQISYHKSQYFTLLFELCQNSCAVLLFDERKAIFDNVKGKLT